MDLFRIILVHGNQYSPLGVCPGGVTPHINRQGGQELKKVITPKKHLICKFSPDMPGESGGFRILCF